MPPRHPLPTVWLMTDERLGNALWPALRRLPRGAGIVFRHYETPAVERRRLFRRVRRVARARDLVLVTAGVSPGSGADGRHNRRSRRPGLRTSAVHDRQELRLALLAGGDALFVSPVFATHSHPGVAPLGIAGLRRLAATHGRPVIALGGMTRRRFERLRSLGIHGWAAIDAWR